MKKLETILEEEVEERVKERLSEDLPERIKQAQSTVTYQFLFDKIGKDLRSLENSPNGRWFASLDRKEYVRQEGATPMEAMFNLYIFLLKKKHGIDDFDYKNDLKKR